MASPTSNPWRWYYGPGEDPETYTEDFATRDEAIAAGRTATDPGMTFSIIEAVDPSPASLSIPTGADLVEHIIDSNEDRWGDDGFSDLVVGKEEVDRAQSELTAMVEAWFARWNHIFPAPTVFCAFRNHEVFTQPAAVDAVEVKGDA